MIPTVPFHLSVEQAIALVKSGDRVFVSGNASTPIPVLEALAARTILEAVELIHALQLGRDPFGLLPGFRHRSLFVGPADREAVNDGRAEYVPVSLSEIPRLFRDGLIPLDLAFVQTSPPDEHGFMSLGTEVIASQAALESAKTVVAVVNPRMPRTLGDCFVHVSRVNALAWAEFELPTLEPGSFGEVEASIGAHVAGLIEDGATLQLGIGAIPNAVLASLEGRRHLGVHTEMISDGVMRALERGIVTNQRKTLHPGKVVGTFVLGSRGLYDFVNDNPAFELHPADYTNDPFVIAQNDRMVAVNSAIEVDLTGQVCSDSIGPRIYSGFGGQLDFIRGAARSHGGKPIIALPSTACNGAVSRIVPILQSGAGVVTTRADVHYVVTEFGVAELFGRSLRERAEALIRVAHPDHREALERTVRERHLTTRTISGFHSVNRDEPRFSEARVSRDSTLEIEGTRAPLP